MKTSITLISSALLMSYAGFAQKAPAPATARVVQDYVVKSDRAAQLEAMAPLPALAGTGSYSYTTVSDKEWKDGELKSKEVSKEISAPKGAEVYIENSSRGIVIKTWDQPKVKVTTTVYYDGESKLTDEEWLERVNLSLKTLGSSVKIKSGGVNGGVYTVNGFSSTFSGQTWSSSPGSGVAVFNGNGQNIGTKSNLKRVVTITVPAGSKLDIESKYADVTIPDNITDANVDIANGNLEAGNLTKLILRSKYSNVNLGDIKTAEVEFTNGRFSAKNIDDMDIESKYSTIEMANAKKLVIRSTNDEIEAEDVYEIHGRKSYGNLRITRLAGSLELDGNNADIKVRNIAPSVSLLKIDNKYADIRLPLREVKAYNIDFAGTYSSVYGNFEKKPVTATVSDKEKDKLEPVTVTGQYAPATRTLAAGRVNMVGSAWSGDNSNPARFTATAGDGKGTKIDIKCPNCTVDFK
jgi:hypothetical protein